MADERRGHGSQMALQMICRMVGKLIPQKQREESRKNQN
jgi:hypothetical protein